MPRIELKNWIVWQTFEGISLRRKGSKKIIEGHAHDTPHYYVIAHRCGYGDDLLRYAVEHDLFHAWLYEYMGIGESLVLNALVAGKDICPAFAAQEEALIQAVQTWVRANVRPIIGGIDWDKLKYDAFDMLDRFYRDDMSSVFESLEEGKINELIYEDFARSTHSTDSGIRREADSVRGPGSGLHNSPPLRLIKEPD